MSYEKINPIQQFNFQINRVLTYGDVACDCQLIQSKTAAIETFDDWEKTWVALGNAAEQSNEYLRAAYYFRMAEFFLKSTDNKKELYYQKCTKYFYKAFDTVLYLNYKKYEIPFEGKFLNCIKIPATNSKGTVLVCGGYDSFIEEFVLQVRDLALKNYDVILFEGPGQGRCLSQNMYFRFDFEKPTTAVLDYFEIKQCAMVGISWGGYFALRSAAFEKRIKSVVAYDVMDNGLEVMTNVFPALLCKIIRRAYYHKHSNIVNALADRVRQKSVLADWALSQGMYITGTKTPFAFYENLSHHTLENDTEKITQNVLLLAGEKDHYIPLNQFCRLKTRLFHARSVTCRLFTEAEGGEQHCQIGNHMLAVNYILDWLDEHFANADE